MKGDFTRFTHDPAKRYKAVLRQQGRADLDADWNENSHIDDYREETTNRDVIGVTGFPKGPSFQVSALADGTVLVQPGRAYVDGILAELHGANPVDYEQQPDLPSPPPINPDSGRRDLVFLDVWERHITAHQDPEIKEVALGGADTGTRVQVVCQIRILQNVGDALTCESPIEDWAPAPSGGRLTTSLDTPAIPPDPCSPLPGSAFRGLENRLYRVEIHEGGDVGGATFKWSRDNGAVTFGIKQFRPNEPKNVELTRLGRDQILSIKTGSFAEVVSDTTELMGTAGTFTSVASDPDLATRVVTLVDDVDSHDGQAHAIVRRWDGDLQQTAAAAFELEDGINVAFSGSDFRIGDYWMFTARTADIGGLEILTDAEPHGIRHHYAKLAFIDWGAAGPNDTFTPVVTDCRPQFPPLTDIDAEDVGFESDVCEFGPEVKTVKDALEALCSEEHECCTLVAEAKVGWEAIFDEILPGQDAAICFRVGDYPINGAQPKIVAGKGHLKLTGAGPGTRILANAGECALLFQNCDSVIVRDLHARGTQGVVGNDLNGVLTFRNCDKVALDSLDVDCAAGVVRRATCLTIRNDQPVADNAGLVEVANCHLHVGEQQVGLLVVNARRSIIRDNRIRVKPSPQNFFLQKVQNKAARSAMASALASGISFRQAKKDAATRVETETDTGGEKPKPTRGKKVSLRVEPNLRLPMGDKELRFATPSFLEEAWQQLLNARPPKDLDEKAVIEHVQALAEQALLGQIPVSGALKDAVDSLKLPDAVAMSQGITVGGRLFDEVTITGNTIVGASQGIHVGLSHHDPARTNPDRGERVLIRGNQVHVAAVGGATRSRHGIFVGNADSIVVRENYATLTTVPALEDVDVDGIRLFGYFGRYINVRENHTDQFPIGIQVIVRGEPAKKPMWQVFDNFTANASQSVFKENNPLVVVSGNVS